MNLLYVTSGLGSGPIVDFAATPTNGFAPLTVSFTNTTSGATSYNWAFGDGNTSTATNAVNVYNNPGVYSVRLTAFGPGGSNALTLTNYITVASSVPPLVSFSGTPTNGFAPLTVSFTNSSVDATSYIWDFGDGNISTAIHGFNIYTNAGTYTVTLTASGPGGTRVLALTNYIVAAIPPPLVSFAGSPTIALAPLQVSFTNSTVGATSYNWNFGDGNSSIATNAVNVYTNPGVYTVTLTAFGPGGSNTLALTNYITAVAPPPPLMAFTGSPTNGLVPLTVNFTNTTTGATNYSWTFGDGKTGATTNASNVYTNAGTYTVTLTAYGPGGSNVLTKTSYITVTNPPPPVVAFVGSPTNGLLPLTVNFTNTTSRATNYIWTFGDGKTGATTNASNVYTNAGTYTVTLTAYGPGGSNALTKTSYIKVTNAPPPVVAFTGTPTNGFAPMTVIFTNRSSGATNYSWTFGDGKTSAATNASNVYSNAGTYTVTLTAVGRGGSNALTQTNYIVVGVGTNTVPFTSTNPIAINAVGQASPYPAGILVSNITATVAKVTVTLSNFTHTATPDVDILLVGPGGQKTYLMSDAGSRTGVTNLTFTFDDTAAATLSQTVKLASGTFKPTNYDTNTDLFIAPAPAGAYPTNLAVFKSIDPNGTWQLYVLDDTATNSGTIGSWTLKIGVLAGTVPVLAPAVRAMTQSVLAPGSDVQLVGAGVIGGNFSFSFGTANGSPYTVQYKESLSETAWNTLETLVGSGAQHTVITPLSVSPQRFYRVTSP